MLSLKAVSTRPDSEGITLDGVDLDIRPGEIVGIAGVEGNGQKTLVRAISALADLAGGSIVLAGHDVTGKPLAARRAIGLRIIPFERNVEGLSLTSSLWQNWSARELLQGSLLKVIRPRRCAKPATGRLGNGAFTTTIQLRRRGPCRAAMPRR